MHIRLVLRTVSMAAFAVCPGHHYFGIANVHTGANVDKGSSTHSAPHMPSTRTTRTRSHASNPDKRSSNYASATKIEAFEVRL